MAIKGIQLKLTKMGAKGRYIRVSDDLQQLLGITDDTTLILTIRNGALIVVPQIPKSTPIVINRSGLRSAANS